MKELYLAVHILISTLMPVSTPSAVSLVLPIIESQLKEYNYQILSTKALSFRNRHPDKTVNDIFTDNIILNLHYLKKDADNFKNPSISAGEKMINWKKLKKPFHFTLTLNPNQTFAFHNDVLPQFKQEKIISGWTNFSYNDGFKQVDGLYGNGVCHLASVLNWAAHSAGLKVTAKVNHDFFPVKGVPKKYGTSILYMGGYSSQLQNLYIKNNFNFPVTFVFDVNQNRLVVSIIKSL